MSPGAYGLETSGNRLISDETGLRGSASNSNKLDVGLGATYGPSLALLDGVLGLRDVPRPESSLT